MGSGYGEAKIKYERVGGLGGNPSNQMFTLFLKETGAAKELIDGGQLGELYHARSTGFRRRGRPFVDGYGSANFVQKQHAVGGALYDMGVYHIGEMLYLLNNPTVQRISGKTYQKTPIDPNREKISGYNVEELGLGFVRFEGGLTLDIIEAWAIHLGGMEGSSIVGTQGGVRFEPVGYYRNAGGLDLD